MIGKKTLHLRLEKGQSLMEFAFGVVILIWLLAVSIDLGRALFTYLALRDAVQEGALYASIHPGSDDVDNVKTRTRQASNMLDGLMEVSENQFDWDIGPTVVVSGHNTRCAGKTNSTVHGMRVKLTYKNFPLIAPFVGSAIGNKGTIAISASATTTIIVPECGQ